MPVLGRPRKAGMVFSVRWGSALPGVCPQVGGTDARRDDGQKQRLAQSSLGQVFLS